MYTFLDFEFNQAFDFEDNHIETDPNCRFEIIQIGAVRMDNSYNIKDNISILIKPTIYKRMHPYVEKMTGITTSSLKDKPLFPEAYKQFRQFIGNDKLLCTWGGSDIRALYRNMVYHKVAEPPIRIEYIDVQNIATKYLKFSHGGTIGLKNAVEALNLPIEEQFHDARSDALYTARVFTAIHPSKPEIKIFNSTHIKTKK